MRVPSGSSDRYLYFVAVDATDLKTRETGLATWTVARSRNGAADAAWTTPTITEIDNTTMPGVYALLIDEDTTIDSGHDEEEVCVHITHAGMAPVTRTYELFRPKMTEGQTATVANGAVDADIERLQGNAIATPTTAGVLEVDLTHIAGSAVSTSTAQLGVNVVNAAGTAWGSGAITAASIANGAIDAATFAADVDAEFRSYVGLAAADLDTQLAALPTAAENADAVWDETATGHTDAGKAGEQLWTDIDAILTDTGTTLNDKIDTIDTNVDSILVDTAEIGAAGAGLTAINLPDQTMNITGNITGNLSGSVGSVTGLTASDVGAIKTQTDKFVFTVANQVDANIQYVNDVQVNGDGQAGTEWGP